MSWTIGLVLSAMPSLTMSLGRVSRKFLKCSTTRAWRAAGSEDTELGVLMELEVGHGETEVYAGVQA